jgi:simple sugar transport system ATP-binding protein
MRGRSDFIVRLQDVSKNFSAINALSRVPIETRAGQDLGLMGDNGARKSTSVKIHAGNSPPTSGGDFVDGKPVHLANPAEARSYGIEVVYQDLAPCNNLAAAASVFLGRKFALESGLFCWLGHNAMAKRADVLFRQLQSETPSQSLARSRDGRCARGPKDPSHG